jgi:hypothetical protein
MSTNILFGQLLTKETNKENLNFDYFNQNYKYLDKNFCIKISKTEFDNLVEKHGFYKGRITKYRDSLSVVFTENFKGDWKKAQIAKNRIGYTWLRLSYHLWQEADEVKSLAKSFNFNHPYLFKEFLINDSINIDVKLFFKDLRNKVKLNTKSSKNISSLSKNELLNFAMVHSYSRVSDFKKLKNTNHHRQLVQEGNFLGANCGRKNCCETN